MRRVLVILIVTAILLLSAVLGWLKLHESALVFVTAESHNKPDGPIPAYASALSIADPDEEAIAALLLPADPAHDSGLWVLHLHGNADTAFSAGQLTHAAQLHALGLNVLVFDYRGFGHSPGTASETHIGEDAEAAYQA